MQKPLSDLKMVLSYRHTLSTLFRPKDFSFQQWGHMAFSGWNKEQFLNGESLYAGLDAFRHWLQPEDTICWWHQEASDLFNMFSKVSGVPDMTQHVVLLCDYIYGYLAGQEASVGSPYKICAARNIATPSPAHCSANDVATMQLLAQGIGFEQKHLLEPPKRWGNDAMAQKGSSAYKLLYDPQAKLLHQSDCELLPDNRHFPAFLTFKLPIRRKYKPCSCCRDEFLDALWDRNQDSIARSEYNYVYSKQSKIFHTRKCSHVLLAYVAGNLADFEKLLKAPYQNEYYVTRNQIAAYESHEIDDICDYLTVHEVLELPYTARSEYVLYRWNDVFDNAEKIRSMVDRLRFQVECFNEALPYEAGQSYGDRAASQVRVIYRIS